MTGDDRFDMLLRSSGQGLEKTAVGWKDMALEGARGVSRSLLGSHGVEGWAPMVKHPLKSIWQGMKNMPWWGVPLQIPTALGMYQDMKNPDKGFFERAGSAAGTVLSFGLAGLGHKGPGHAGSMLGQELLAGRGMLFHEGLLTKGGRKLDELMHLGKKNQPLRVPTVQPASRWEPHRVLNTAGALGAATGYLPTDSDWSRE